MKSTIYLLFAIIQALPALMATPDPGTTISERFLGSTAENYAVLRTECENPGSYYTDRTKVWLIEHPKDPASGKQPLRTLMLDQTNQIDASDPKNQTTTLHFKDQKTSLGDIIDRFQMKDLVPWTQEQTAALKFDQATGLTEFKSQRLWEGSKQADETKRAGFTLLAVAEDHNCIFLTIRKGGDQDSETTLLCIPPSITRNVHALRKLEPIHLSAGSYSTAEEALSSCKSLRKSSMVSGCGRLQVWSVFQADSGKTEYAVVMEETARFLREDKLGAKQQRTDLPNWVPITSEGFRELVVEPAP